MFAVGMACSLRILHLLRASNRPPLLQHQNFLFAIRQLVGEPCSAQLPEFPSQRWSAIASIVERGLKEP